MTRVRSRSTFEFTLGPAQLLLLRVRKCHIIPETQQREHAATLFREGVQLLLRKLKRRNARLDTESVWTCFKTDNNSKGRERAKSMASVHRATGLLILKRVLSQMATAHCVSATHRRTSPCATKNENLLPAAFKRGTCPNVPLLDAKKSPCGASTKVRSIRKWNCARDDSPPFSHSLGELHEAPKEVIRGTYCGESISGLWL